MKNPSEYVYHGRVSLEPHENLIGDTKEVLIATNPTIRHVWWICCCVDLSTPPQHVLLLLTARCPLHPVTSGLRASAYPPRERLSLSLCLPERKDHSGQVQQQYSSRGDGLSTGALQPRSRGCSCPGELRPRRTPQKWCELGLVELELLARSSYLGCCRTGPLCSCSKAATHRIDRCV